jgi:hypothetical protein
VYAKDGDFFTYIKIEARRRIGSWYWKLNKKKKFLKKKKRNNVWWRIDKENSL